MKAKPFYAMFLAGMVLLAGCGPAPASSATTPPQTTPAPVAPHVSDGLAGSASASNGQGQAEGNAVLAQMFVSHSAQDFVDGEVPDEDITAMLRGAVRAPSAKNEQPWHFTVVKSEKLVLELYDGARPGNVAVVLSGQKKTTAGMTDYDCGLAAGYLQLAAESMGYGARILISPVRGVEKRRDLYGIPEGYDVLTVTIIGPTAAPPDAAASATGRKALDEVVNTVAG